MSLEGFEPLKSFEDLYLINKEGRIWSLIKRKFLKSTKKIYENITLRKDGKYKYTTIHRLLGIQYISNPDNLPEIDHINRNPLDNNLSNLRWVSIIQNRQNKENYIEPEKRKIHKSEYDKNYRLKNKDRILERERLYRLKRKDLTPVPIVQ